MPSPPKQLSAGTQLRTQISQATRSGAFDGAPCGRVEARRQAHSSIRAINQKYIDASRKVSTAHISNVSGVPTRTNSLKR